MNAVRTIASLAEEVNDLMNLLEMAQSEYMREVEVFEEDREIWRVVARLEAENDQLFALFEDLGIPDNLSVAQELAIKQAIAEVLAK